MTDTRKRSDEAMGGAVDSGGVPGTDVASAEAGERFGGVAPADLGGPVSFGGWVDTDLPDDAPDRRGWVAGRAGSTWLTGAVAGPLDGAARRSVLAACRAGLRSVDRDAAEFGAWELQAGMARHTVELAALGLGHALAGGHPRTILRWADLHRAVSGERPPVLPPSDPVLADDLAALRAARANGPSRQVRTLEARVRARDFVAPGPTAPRRSWSYPELAAALGDTALVSVFFHGGNTFLASYVDGRARVRRVARALAVEAAARTVRFGAMVGVTEHGLRGATRRAAVELDRALFGPARAQLADRPVVLVPSGALHVLPWAALPSLAGRPVSVAPSVSAWLRALRVGPAHGDPVWLAGPGLRHAAREARALHAAHGGTILTGRHARADRALAAMDGAALLHVAAHGEFRSDQPMFSRLALSGGSLYGYDAQRLGRAPRLVVLSSCESARTAVRPCGSALGMATAWLRAGSAAVIASVLPVPDSHARDLSTTLHRALADGAGPAAALARAQAEHGDLGFSCYGAG